MTNATVRPASRGQSLVEFLIVVPTFLFLLLAAFQMALVYRAKTTLDYAVMEAARRGAVNGADMMAMRQGLAAGLAPLYTTSPDAGGATAGFARAFLDVANPIYTRIEIVNPTREAFADFRERQYNGRYALPNDTLAFRGNAVGASSGLTIQDANVLKIRVVYSYPLIVPFAREVIAGTSRAIGSVPIWERVVLINGRLPIESYAVVRMQSPIYEEGNLPRRN